MIFGLHFFCCSGLTFFKAFEQYLSSCFFSPIQDGVAKAVTFEADKLLVLPEQITEYFRCRHCIYLQAHNKPVSHPSFKSTFETPCPSNSIDLQAFSVTLLSFCNCEWQGDFWKVSKVGRDPKSYRDGGR